MTYKFDWSMQYIQQVVVFLIILPLVDSCSHDNDSKRIGGRRKATTTRGGDGHLALLQHPTVIHNIYHIAHIQGKCQSVGLHVLMLSFGKIHGPPSLPH